MLSEAYCVALEPLDESRQPGAITAAKELLRTISAILWRHQKGAKSQPSLTCGPPSVLRAMPGNASHVRTSSPRWPTHLPGFAA